ncbi:single-stranded DNA-binding protein [Nocardioides donggukensis]|uniref:Single-stranded DNA-binding protein n=1 Tax=Nocardioides donggukensis TaxID=2774019 RepID=A0A927PZC5_9ACTN|nr:single-stranded DNA-binding protein [Nocardioides donggukensis]MBD8868890.1 single-stranded DNA-binding protein [Nocardioides donggukensis]
MNETYVTLTGWLGSDVTERIVGSASVATFRVASTPRRYNRRDNAWTDGETTWYTVNAWRTLGRNCLDSLRQGDPVTVHGKLTAQVWTDPAGVKVQSFVVEAVAVGHDLSRGVSEFTKRLGGGTGEADDSALREANAGYGVGGPQISSAGETLDDMVEDDKGASASAEPAA